MIHDLMTIHSLEKREEKGLRAQVRFTGQVESEDLMSIERIQASFSV